LKTVIYTDLTNTFNWIYAMFRWRLMESPQKEIKKGTKWTTGLSPLVSYLATPQIYVYIVGILFTHK